MKSADFWRSRQNPEFDVTLRCLIEMFGCETEHSKFALFNFYHFYTIHTHITPLHLTPLDITPLHLCSCQTKEHTYKKLLKGLSAIAKNTKPSRILLDFERAALNPFASHIERCLKAVFIYYPLSYTD